MVRKIKIPVMNGYLIIRKYYKFGVMQGYITNLKVFNNCLSIEEINGES